MTANANYILESAELPTSQTTAMVFLAAPWIIQLPEVDLQRSTATREQK